MKIWNLYGSWNIMAKCGAVHFKKEEIGRGQRRATRINDLKYQKKITSFFFYKEENNKCGLRE